MARVHTKIARKEYIGIHGETIKPGDTYYSWTPYRSGTRKSLPRPLPSEVESNYTRAALMRIEEVLGDTHENYAEALESAASEADDVSSELSEKAENIESGFQHETEQSELFRGQSEEVDAWAMELRDAAAEIETIWPDSTEFPSEPDEPYEGDYEDDEAGYREALLDYEEAGAQYMEEFANIEDRETEAYEKFEEIVAACPSI